MTKQTRFSVVKDEPGEEITTGTDEFGAFEVNHLSMVLGGETKPHNVHTGPIRHIVNASSPTPRGWYKDKTTPKNVRPRPCYTEALLTTPYGGFCHVGCKFCYVDHGTRGYRATGLSTVNPNYPDEMRKAVGKMLISGAAYISSFTEPFQALEAKYHVTQRLAQVFVDNNLPLFFLSRLDPPDWAVDALLQNPYSYMQWSVNTSNPDQYRRMSPGAIKLDKLWQAMDKLSDQGVYISVQCNPVLPGIVDLEDLINLINIGASVGMKHIIFKFVEQVYNNRKLLIERLAKVPGVEELDSLLTQTIGGVYTIREDVRREWLGELLKATRKAGITMSTCYEYYADGGAGANLAPWFTTSDQCHGRGVPVHYRTNLSEQFQPLPGCFRKGCLYCSEFGTQACGNPTLLEAKALKYKDFRTIQLVGDENDWCMNDSCAKPEDAWQSVNGNPWQQTDMELWEKYS